MARILLAISKGLKINGKFVASGFMEQFIDSLVDNGNEIMLYIPDLFQRKVFSGNNDLLSNIDAQGLKKDVKSFNPELVITFNNTIFNDVVNIVDCPIIIWGADSESFWNSKDLIKQNVDRYLFFCFSEQEMKPRQELFGIKDNRIFLVKPATNLKNLNLEKDKNISFIGTCFSASSKWLYFVDKNRGKSDLQKLINNFSNYFIEKNDILEAITDESLLKDFKRIDKSEYVSFFSGEKRIETLFNISKLGLHIYGDDSWRVIKNLLPSLYACVHKESLVTAKENEWCYNTSKICININHDQSINGMNFRICDILASGGCLVSSFSPFVKKQFIGLEIPMYNNSYEAVELCNKYLKEDNLREDFVLKSNEMIKQGWSFNTRLKEITEITGINLINGKDDVKGQLTILQPHFKNFSLENLLLKLKKG